MQVKYNFINFITPFLSFAKSGPDLLQSFFLSDHMIKSIATQNDWDDLLDMILGKQVTPVLGKEVYQFLNPQSNQSELLDGWLARQLLSSYQVSGQPEMGLTQAVNYLVGEKKVKSWDLVRPLKNWTKSVSFGFPILDQLAGITDLTYFLNTEVYDDILVHALENHTQKTVTNLNWSARQFRDCEALESLTAPLVLNIFGSLNAVDLALSDEELLEYTGSFFEGIKSTPNILNALDQNLLFIGCDFPDWMSRFVIRLLSNEPLHQWGDSNRKVYFINNDNQFQSQPLDFLRNYELTTYNGTTSEFVQELGSQWQRKNGKSKMVFLSYSRKDKDSVESLKTSLETIPNLSCWYDKDDITAGDDFKEDIIVNIKKADLFIPLLSANSLADKDSYVFKEWSQADIIKVVKKEENQQVGNFLMPVTIDDTDRADARIPDFFKSLNIEQVLQGKPDDKFISDLKKVLGLI